MTSRAQIVCLLGLIVHCTVCTVPVEAQQKTAHYMFNARQPAGEIGRAQLARRPDLVGFFQPVRIKVPRTSTVSMADGAGFGQEYGDATLVSLQVGEVYRLQVSYIPNRTGSVYPTIELLDRMHPPQGKETRYPIPIDIAIEDVLLAMQGKFVTRVIYVEDPSRAVPARDLPEQRYVEVLPNEDPLLVAGDYGRPVAILRMGSVTPGPYGPDANFLFGSPPVVQHQLTAVPRYEPSDLNPSDVPITPGKQNALPDVPELPGPQADDEVTDTLPEVAAPVVEDSEDIFDDEPADPAIEPDEPAADDSDNPFGDDITDEGDADFDPFGDVGDDEGFDDAADEF